MNKFSVVAKKDECSRNIENILKTRLKDAGWQEESDQPELVIFVGGDGTFLYAAHKYMHLENTAFVGIHTGTLGFFTDYTKDELDICLQDIINQEGETRGVPLLRVDIIKKSGTESVYAINEMRIENVIQTLDLELMIDNEFFENYRGTGMCVCTQAGSTAYNRSLKGAVIDEGLNLMQLHEITGIHHSLYHSLGVPLILNNNRIISMKSKNFASAILCYDHKHMAIDDVLELKISMCKKEILFIHYRQNSYLKRLRNLY